MAGMRGARLRLSIIAALVLLHAGMAQPQTSALAASTIPFQQEILSNGLRVIYVPLPHSPVVHVRVTYHVGSRDDPPGRRGFAHLFEHMTFRGSAHVASQELMRLITSVGGSCNGTTDPDTTSYFATVPSNQLKLALYVEADRMAKFGVTEEIFRIERDVVIEEWRRHENNLADCLLDRMLAQTFTAHPYRFSSIGNMTDLRAAKVGELQAFYDRYYTPTNAVLVIAGNFDPAEARALASQYFAWIPGGAPIARSQPSEPAQKQFRRVELAHDKPQAAVLVSIRTPAAGSADDAALAVLDRAIEHRLSSYLCTSAHPQCSRVFCRLQRLEDGGCMIFGGIVLPGVDPADVERAILAHADMIRFEGIRSYELAGVVDDFNQQAMHIRRNPSAIAAMLGLEAAITGKPERVEELFTEIAEMTQEKIAQTAERFLVKQGLTLISVHPGGTAQDDNAPEPSAQPAPATTIATTPRHIEFPADYPAKPAVNPDVPLPPNVGVQAMEVAGLKLAVIPRRQPEIAWTLVFPTGSVDDPPGKEGLTRLTCWSLAFAAGQRPTDRIRRTLQDGLEFSFHENGDFVVLNGRCHADTAPQAMRRWNELVGQPLESGIPLDEPIWRLKWKVWNDIIAIEDDPRTLAQQALLAELLQGSADYRVTSASLRSITLSDIAEWEKRMFRQSGGVLVLTGPINDQQAELLAKILMKGFASDKPVGERADSITATRPATAPARDIGGPRVILLDLPHATQSVIRMGAPAYASDSDDAPAGELAGVILSAGLHSRLGRFVREETGYVYNILAEFRPARRTGIFVGATETGFDNTAATIAAMLDSFSQMSRQPITAEELNAAKRHLAGAAATGFQALNEQPASFAQLALAGRGFEVAEWVRRLQSTDSQSIQRVMAQYVQPTRMTIVVVAPANRVKSQLESRWRVEVLPASNRRAGAATRPAWLEIPKPE